MARPRIHSLDQHFFDNIDSERKAYWLGFLAADGCNSGRCIMLTLAVRDVGHIEQFKADVGASYPIAVDHRKATIALSSLKMVKSLEALGFGRRKTHRLAMPPLDQSLLHHFVRGLFDGDGCVHIGPKVVCANITTAYRMAHAVHNILHSVGIASVRTRPHYQSEFTRVVWISRRNDLVRFRNWLYADATVCLERKRKLLEAIGPIVDRICMHCGSMFSPRYRDKGQYCSRKCYGQVYYAANRDAKWKVDGVWKQS